VGGTGDDFLYGGPGDDIIDARDGEGGNDFVSGGTGTDTCYFDPDDFVVGCEVLNPTGG
jgi:Ca2+-binding RTX toxin-like protein